MPSFVWVGWDQSAKLWPRRPLEVSIQLKQMVHFCIWNATWSQNFRIITVATHLMRFLIKGPVCKMGKKWWYLALQCEIAVLDRSRSPLLLAKWRYPEDKKLVSHDWDDWECFRSRRWGDDLKHFMIYCCFILLLSFRLLLHRFIYEREIYETCSLTGWGFPSCCCHSLKIIRLRKPDRFHFISVLHFHKYING